MRVRDPCRSCAEVLMNRRIAGIGVVLLLAVVASNCDLDMRSCSGSHIGRKQVASQLDRHEERLGVLERRLASVERQCAEQAEPGSH